MNDKIFVETDRLILRQWKNADEDLYAAMNADPVVMEFFPALLTREQSLLHLHSLAAHIDQYGWGLFAIERKDTGDWIGFTGLHKPSFNTWFTPCVEIGWRIAAVHWNKGFATEAASACIRFAFHELNLSDLYSFTAIQNRRSEKVMQKNGMQKIGIFDHPNLPDGHWLQKHILYRITK
jgi:RimJ/RimL family protein N-acetyltransferase